MTRPVIDVGRGHVHLVADQLSNADRTDRAPVRRAYARPRLVAIVRGADLLDVLGPAQAGYGGGGFP